MDLPKSYKEINEKEQEILKLAENFLRQYRILYPLKQEPPLYFENECSVKKITCTTLCPTRLVKPMSLNECKSSASFLSDYMKYVHLSPSNIRPLQLHSLDNILNRRFGNSLDMSMLLCTFLLSSDYEAYVVQGYATTELTKMTLIMELNPLDLLPEKFKHYIEGLKSENNCDVSTLEKYKLDFEKARKFWMEGISEKSDDETEPGLDNNKVEDTVSHKKEIHFWVLLRTSKKELYFVEASTGVFSSPSDPKYLGIEFVWNNRNFWCLKKEYTGSCRDISFIFKDSSEWEQFLPDYKISDHCDESQIRMPETWIQEFEVNNEQVDNRFPPEGKITSYKKVKVKRHNAQSLESSMVFKLTYYSLRDGIIDKPESTLSFFEGRNDKMEYRNINIKDKVIAELFVKGREDAIKKHICSLENSEFIQTIEFYSDLQKDNLSKRKWTRTWVRDHFSDRNDFLSVKEVFYEKNQIWDSSEAKLESEDKNKVVMKDENKENANLAYQITPLSFESLDPLFENVEFSELNPHEFLQMIDPSERYVSPDSESEAESLLKTVENRVDEKIPPKMENILKEGEDINQNSSFSDGSNLTSMGLGKENLKMNRYSTVDNEYRESQNNFKKNYEENAKDKMSGETSMKNKTDDEQPTTIERTKQSFFEANQIKPLTKKTTNHKFSSENETASETSKSDTISITIDDFDGEDNFETVEATTESSRLNKDNFEKEDKTKVELEAYENINFETLSDEELEVNYNLHLFKLWEEFTNEKNLKLFCMEDYNIEKNKPEKKNLEIKRRIIRKHRKTQRYKQRIEHGKPKVRVFTKKSDDTMDDKFSQVPKLISHLHLNEMFGDGTNLKEFHKIECLDEEYVNHAEAEIMKEESLKLCDQSVRKFKEMNKTNSDPVKSIIYTKKTFSLDPSVLMENSIKHLWFLFETNSYRIDFHFPERRSSGRILFFTKPGCGSTVFSFHDYLCRQIVPSYETTTVSEARLYSYLMFLLKMEPLILKEQEAFERNFEILLATREREMTDVRLELLQS